MTKAEIALELAITYISSGKSLGNVSASPAENGQIIASLYNAILQNLAD